VRGVTANALIILDGPPLLADVRLMIEQVAGRGTGRRFDATENQSLAKTALDLSGISSADAGGSLGP
jgi:hypothetical protein